MEKIYYVYVYLDPEKPGNFKFGDFIFNFEPFYIGKGKGKRKYYHWNYVINDRKSKFSNIHFLNKLKLIESKKYSPLIIEIKSNLTDKESLNLEKKLILLIGRSHLNEGPLTNITTGGDGIGSYRIRSDKGKKRNPLSEEHKKKLSKSHKGKILSEKHKNNIAKGSKGTDKTWTDESYKKSLESKRKKWPSKEKVLQYIEKYKTKILISKELGISHPTFGTICDFYNIKMDWNKNIGGNTKFKKK